MSRLVTDSIGLRHDLVDVVDGLLDAAAAGRNLPDEGLADLLAELGAVRTHLAGDLKPRTVCLVDVAKDGAP